MHFKTRESEKGVPRMRAIFHSCFGVPAAIKMHEKIEKKKFQEPRHDTSQKTSLEWGFSAADGLKIKSNLNSQ